MKDYDVNKMLKILKFMGNTENRTLIIWFFTILAYVILILFYKNTFVLLFGYFLFFFLFSKLYNYIYTKIYNKYKAFIVKDVDTSFSADDSK